MNPLSLAIFTGYAFPIILVVSAAVGLTGLVGLGAAALIQKIVNRK